jgi:DNA polymerase elongation subunit (family B)
MICEALLCLIGRQVKSVVSYGKHWVKSQARMTATSNQEVFRAVITGRIVIDMLRVILVAYNLSTFTLAECSQVYLSNPY